MTNKVVQCYNRDHYKTAKLVYFSLSDELFIKAWPNLAEKKPALKILLKPVGKLSVRFGQTIVCRRLGGTNKCHSFL